MKTTRILILLGLTLLVLTGCYKNPHTGKMQYIDMDAEREMTLGMQGFTNIQIQYPKASEEMTERIQRIADRITPLADRPNYNWEVFVAESDTFNASCYPGGKIVFYSALVDALETDEAIALVMGHEITHALLRHTADKITRLEFIQALTQLAATQMQTAQQVRDLNTLVGTSTTIGVMLPLSRENEFDADRIGLILATKAGFDTHKAALGLNVLVENRKKAKYEAPEYLATHPHPQNRQDRLKAMAQDIHDTYAPKNLGGQEKPLLWLDIATPEEVLADAQ
ncbi:MAG: M48 family metallopeptidase [Desulfovibrio sp.]